MSGARTESRQVGCWPLRHIRVPREPIGAFVYRVPKALRGRQSQAGCAVRQCALV